MRTNRQYKETVKKHFVVHILEVIKHLCCFQVGWCQHDNHYTFNFRAVEKELSDVSDSLSCREGLVVALAQSCTARRLAHGGQDDVNDRLFAAADCYLHGDAVCQRQASTNQHVMTSSKHT